MRVRCPHCSKAYRINDALVAPGGIRVRCPKCAQIFPVYQEREGAQKKKSKNKRSEEQSEATQNESHNSTMMATTRGGDAGEDDEELSVDDVHDNDHVVSHVQAENSMPDELSRINFDSDPVFEDSRHGEASLSEITDPKPETNTDTIPPYGDSDHIMTPSEPGLFREDTPLQPGRAKAVVRQRRRPLPPWLRTLFFVAIGVMAGIFGTDFWNSRQPPGDLQDSHIDEGELQLDNNKDKAISPDAGTTVDKQPKPADTTVKPPAKRPVKKKRSKKNTVSVARNYRTYIRKGDQAYSKAEYRQALGYYQQALPIASDKEAFVHTKIGFSWLRLYRVDEAFDSFSSALKIDGNLADAHKGLGEVYDHLGDLDKAKREYSLYLQLNPGAADAARVRELLRSLRN